MRIPLIAPWGLPEVAAVFLLCVGCAAALWLVSPLLTLVPLPLLLFSLFFFRDPARVVPQEDGLVISPADGKVVEISEESEPYFTNLPCVKIGIFLSLLDVHVNRAPTEGVVKDTRYRRGKFRNAQDPRCASENENNAILIYHARGDFHYVLRQIAGVVARRIVCAVPAGTTVARGQKIGMIKFGSRAEIYLPKEKVRELSIRIHDRVTGGETVLARLNR